MGGAAGSPRGGGPRFDGQVLRRVRALSLDAHLIELSDPLFFIDMAGQSLIVYYFFSTGRRISSYYCCRCKCYSAAFLAGGARGGSLPWPPVASRATSTASRPHTTAWSRKHKPAGMRRRLGLAITSALAAPHACAGGRTFQHVFWQAGPQYATVRQYPHAAFSLSWAGLYLRSSARLKSATTPAASNPRDFKLSIPHKMIPQQGNKYQWEDR